MPPVDTVKSHVVLGKFPEITEEAQASQASDTLSGSESLEVEKRKASSARAVHEVVRFRGDDELDRPATSLALSSLAAGVAITASVFAQAAIALRLEDAPEADIDTGLGNAIGFMIVVMGRMQLFTEKNVTTVLPVIRDSN